MKKPPKKNTNKESQNCWEFMNCPKNDKEECLVFQNDMGKECWFVPHIKKACPEKYDDCTRCPWYKELNCKEE